MPTLGHTLPTGLQCWEEPPGSGISRGRARTHIHTHTHTHTHTSLRIDLLGKERKVKILPPMSWAGGSGRGLQSLGKTGWMDGQGGSAVLQEHLLAVWQIFTSVPRFPLLHKGSPRDWVWEGLCKQKHDVDVYVMNDERDIKINKTRICSGEATSCLNSRRC